MDNTEKAKLGAETLKNFCQQFGSDVYSVELLTILFEELMKMTPDQIFNKEINDKGEFAEGLFNSGILSSEKEHEGNS